MVEKRQQIEYATPGWDEDKNTTTAPIDRVTSLVQVLLNTLNTFACALDALSVAFVEAFSQLRL